MNPFNQFGPTFTTSEKDGKLITEHHLDVLGKISDELARRIVADQEKIVVRMLPMEALVKLRDIMTEEIKRRKG